MYDATEIFRTLPGHKKETFIKLGFYLLSFFYYLYRWEQISPVDLMLTRSPQGWSLRLLRTANKGKKLWFPLHPLVAASIYVNNVTLWYSSAIILNGYLLGIVANKLWCGLGISSTRCHLALGIQRPRKKIHLYGTTDPSSLPVTKKRRHWVLRSPTYSEHSLTLEQPPGQTTEMESSHEQHGEGNDCAAARREKSFGFWNSSSPDRGKLRAGFFF